MAKQSGLGDQLFIGGYDIGADTSSIGALSTPRNTLPSTGITSSANERIFGDRDGHAEFTTFFNPGPVGGPLDNEHKALRGLPTADTAIMYCRGSGIGNEAFCMSCKQIDYNPTRGDDGSLTFNVNCEANSFGADWALQLTAGKETDAGAGSNASIDTTASLNFGWQAYLQVFSIGSGTATITIEDSADNSSFLTLSGAVFTAVAAAPTFERLQSSSATATVRRYIRVTTSGVFTNLVFAVAILKNDAARAL